MEISNRRINLKQQISFALGFTEILNPGDRNGSGPQEIPFVQSSISGIDPNPVSEERSNKEKLAPITPNKTEVQFANKTLETDSIANEDKTLNDDQQPSSKKPRRKKYKPKVVREEGTKGAKTWNLKSGNSNPGFSPQNPVFKVPITPSRSFPTEIVNSKSGNSDPGFSHQNPELKPDSANVSAEVPITPNPKSETTKNISVLDPITLNPKYETSKNIIILDPITPNPKSETSKSTSILDPITPSPKSDNSNDSTIQDPIKPESKVENLRDAIIPVIKKDIVYFSKKKRNLKRVNEKKDVMIIYERRQKRGINVNNKEKKDNLEENTASNCDDVAVPVQKPVRRRLDFENEATSGTELDLFVNKFSIGTSLTCEDLIKDSNIGAESDKTLNKTLICTSCEDVMNDSSIGTESDETLTKSLIYMSLNCEDLKKVSSVGKQSDETLNESLIGTSLNCEDVMKDSSIGTKSDETLNKTLIGTTRNCEDVIEDCCVGTKSDETENESFVGTESDPNLIKNSIVTVPNCENVIKPVQETEIISKIENLNKGFDRLALMENLRSLRIKNFKGAKLKKENKQKDPKPKPKSKPKRKRKPELSLKKLMNEIVKKMRKLDLNKDRSAIVPFEAIKVRAKVVLNEESINEWKIVMGLNDGASSSRGVNLEKEEYWRAERENFENLAHGFIYQMKLIQGDRKFSEWNSTVVDSVVGAFLTQNVSDHLSSSAFISLASRFPPKKENGNTSTWPDEKSADSEWEKAKSSSDPQNTPIIENNNNNNNNNNNYNNVPKVGKKGYRAGTETIDWDELRRYGLQNRYNKERENIINNNNINNFKREDSVDWEGVRNSEVGEVSKAIHGRGMDNVLAERIQDFLNRVANDHGSVDLEWLREVPEEKAKDYLLSIYGLGLKSVECIRLLTLHQVAFPVDTNVGRICVRLGWVPLEPLPEAVQIHLLELYPVMDSIQKYLWPRLCKLDQKTLYELHYQMITFGKVFCTKSKPNCNSCPLRSECKHFASAFASARLALPGPDSISAPIVQTRNPFSFSTNSSSKSENPIPILPNSSKSENPIPTLPNSSSKSENPIPTLPNSSSKSENPIPTLPNSSSKSENPIPTLPNSSSKSDNPIPTLPNSPSETGNPIPVFTNSSEPIIEEPSTPTEQNQEHQETSDIEDLFSCSDSEEIPTIKLDMSSFMKNVEKLVRESENREEVRIEDISRALVALPPVHASIPVPELKNPGRLRTVHDAYELPDGHSILKWLDFEKRVADDPCPYLLILWNSDKENTSGSSVPLSEEEKNEYVQGSILIPCRTAMGGSFPLNGTYFQVNEVFADHYTARNPIRVLRDEIWRLRRLPCYFGTSVSTVLKGLPTDTIQFCFWRGFICVREFDRETRSPKPLSQWLHFNPSKIKKTPKKAA